jgi:acetate kinase
MASSDRHNDAAKVPSPEPDAPARTLAGASGSASTGGGAARVLTINGGSSSIKFALYTPGQPPRRELAGSIERIGLPDGVLNTRRGGEQPEHSSIDTGNYEQAVGQLIEWLDKAVGMSAIAAIGHRVVHGGPRFRDPQLVTPEVMEELHRLSALDPDHLPGEIALIEGFTRSVPDRPQVICFDTAFHRDMPRVARLLPIPRRFDTAGIQRYGFHGLSYTYLLEELGRIAGPAAVNARVVLAHLGAGASLAAVRGGKCIDTTMAFTPTSGLMMGTRTGDLDPGVLLYLLRTERMTAEQIDDLANRQAGLLGVSETSSDMRDLLHRQQSDHRAAEAVTLFCYLAKKWIGAFCAALGGLDTLVFAGGIGENAPEIRTRICEGLEFIGIEMDQERNASNAPLVSRDASPVAVRVIRTDEESVIAKAVYRILG